MNISVIIPVLDEENHIAETLSAIPCSDCEELIVVDGGSRDRTVSLAAEFTKKVFVTRRGRGRQMNFGAGRAQGEILLFLHADCRLPDHGFAMIRKVLREDGIAAGAFDLAVDHPSFRFRIIEIGANVRSRITSVPYGDQGVFMRREVFHAVGGFPDIPLMEDIAMARKLKKRGKIRFIRPPIRTSPRRWLEEGLIYTTFRDWTLALSYSVFNVSPDKLEKFYRDVR